MLLTFFDEPYFLQSIGWAIANSLWQTGILWLIYLSITFRDKKLSAFVKYQFSFVLLLLSFTWFVFTVVQNYQLLIHDNSGIRKNWLINFGQLNSALPFLAVAYFTILTFYIIKFLWHIHRLRFVRTRFLKKASVDVRIFTNNTALQLGIKRKVQVWLSENVDVPSVIGFIKPIILLPVAIINHLSTQQVNAILLHELAHIKRNDYLLNFVQCIIRMILFFNPFAILLDKAARKERENCCDDWVMNFQYNQFEYAKALLVLEEQRLQHLQLVMAATNGKKILLSRIERIFTAQTRTTNTSFFQKFKLVSICVFLFAGIGIMTPAPFNSPSYKKRLGENNIRTTSFSMQAVVSNVSFAPENSSKTIVNKSSVGSQSKKIKPAQGRLAKKQKVADTDKEYLLAMVNEDLLQKNKPATVPLQVSIKEKDSVRTVYLKIEEEQSGKKQVNTYILQLKDDNGNPEIKPLLIMKKYKGAMQKRQSIKLPGAKLNPGKKRVST